MKNIIDKIEILRHSTAHVLAASVLKMFPEAKFAIGPAIADGFYYDFDLPRTLIPEDLALIEAEMQNIINKNYPFEKAVINIDEAINLFKKAKQDYKVEILEDLKNKGEKEVSIYQSDNFVDLCKGPHLDSTGEINKKSIKLIKISGAYWKGDEKRKMLQRIYGLAFYTPKDLKKHLAQMKEAEKRDHRKIGKDLDFFVFSDLVGKGLPLLTEKGSVIRRELERYIVDEEIKRGYQHVYSQDLAKVDLYRKSGHYPYYKKTMYPSMIVDDEELILRPMACPHHFELYKSKLRSYRELPLRIAEIAKLYRYEKSGELTGLIRVRDFCLADSHIFCRESQAEQELKDVLQLIDDVSRTLGFKKNKDYRYRLSLGNRKDTKKYYKNDQAWDKAEKILKKVLIDLKAPFYEETDQAAFYGPKIDIQMKNFAGKEDTAFTVQYDFCMPDRFDLTYKNEKGKDERAIVIHRSSIGSIERTIGFLIEYYAGSFPLWLSPIQVAVIPVSDKFIKPAQNIMEKLFAEKIRVVIDDRNESVGKKISDTIKQKIPYTIVYGDKEAKSKNLAIRVRGSKEIKNQKLEDFIKNIKNLIDNKSLDL